MKKEKRELLLSTAHSWAKQMHRGQKYGDKDYFEYHILPVTAMTRELVEEDPSFTKTEKTLAEVVALLHDIVEDTEVTSGEVLRNFGSTVAQEVINLTKTKNMTRENQWASAKRGRLSTVVKKADMLVNLKTSLKTNNPRLIDKYLTGLAYLSGTYTLPE